MNGDGLRRTPSSSDYDPRYSLGPKIQPSSKAMLDGYNGSLGNFDSDRTHQAHHNHVRPYVAVWCSVELTFFIDKWGTRTKLGPFGPERPCRNAPPYGDSNRGQPTIRCNVV